MKKPAALFVLSLAFAGPAAAATDAELQKAIIGTWGDEVGCTSGILVFNSDGSFSSRNGSDPTDRQDGTYQIKDGHLTGKTADHEMPDITLVYDGKTLVFQNKEGGKDELHPCAK